MVLRPASLPDAEMLAAFARDAFVAAFGALYSAEDLAAFLASERTEGRYRSQIADPRCRVMLAFMEGRLVAYSLVTLDAAFPQRPPPRPARPLYLGQLYCAANMSGQGVGAALMDDIMAYAGASGCDAVQLSVFSGNTGAQRFYARYGFAKVADIDFWVGNHRDDEYLFECRLDNGGG